MYKPLEEQDTKLVEIMATQIHESGYSVLETAVIVGTIVSRAVTQLGVLVGPEKLGDVLDDIKKFCCEDQNGVEVLADMNEAFLSTLALKKEIQEL